MTPRSTVLERDARILGLFAEHAAHNGGPAAALSPSGRVLAAVGAGWAGAHPALWGTGRIEIPADASEVALRDGTEAAVHQLGEGTLMLPSQPARSRPRTPSRLELLGKVPAIVAARAAPGRRARGLARRVIRLVPAAVATAAALGVAGLAYAAPPERSPATPRRTVVIGRSVDGRPLVAHVIGPDSASRRLLLVGCIHGDECAGLRILSALAHRRPPRGVQLWLVGELNPDGTAVGMRQNADGVDLNRNFPYQWHRVTDPTYYSGPRPESEPETQAAIRLIRRIQPAVTVWYHQHQDLVDMAGGDRGVARRYARSAHLRATCLAFLPGTAPGWENHVLHGTSSFVVELPAGPVGALAVSRHLQAVAAMERGQRVGSRTRCTP
jgi:murein peptide amidase A